jgi:hypothetical protein
MAERKGKRDEIVLDAIFDRPAEVDEFVFDDNILEGLVSGTSGGEAADSPFGLATPKVLRIVSQDVRKNKAGNQIVDVIFEVEDVPGAKKYEFRVTKL